MRKIGKREREKCIKNKTRGEIKRNAEREADEEREERKKER